MTTHVITFPSSGLEEANLSKSDQSSPERISEAEHAVMEALWDQGTATASDVCKAVCEKRGWSLATVKTLLSRLVQKGAIETRPDGRRYIYSPLIARSDYVGGESRRLVDRLFGGKAASLVAHLAETEALTEDDLSAIEALLKELKS
ncbi:BlaI/MecI/CopY family transcriptional regulator [uncultured Erythrobacter sp.]|uniref:BlaI/MecI/CopY family transcriptional regulator n=1 Tax=uncultured Erythrobacter sp. TaxID=263913 RepID=UPI0026275AA3|nr:BlaI/MecI/CopY family transcriptional regulator [uncultured Erythrobacter sp.]